MSQATFVTIAQTIAAAAARFEKHKIDTPKLDARLLFEFVSGMSNSQIISNANEPVSNEQLEQFEKLLQKRLEGVPVFRIIGKREFFGREFKIFPNVLDPRPETELLVELIAQEQNKPAASFLEIGVGSGAISISLLAQLNSARAVATDISSDAIEAAKFNAKQIGVLDRLTLVESDCMTSVAGQFDFIVSNPPYIDSDQLQTLEIEVLDHDPLLALDGGKNGLEFYKRIFEQARGHLFKDGKLYLETGSGQHEKIVDLAKKMGWGLISKHLDLSGLERIVVFKDMN